MKRLSLYLFLLLFTLQTPSQADDIRDFQIEGMSIGDSLLDHFSEEEINDYSRPEWFKNDKFTPVSGLTSNKFETYEVLQIAFKTKDKKKSIYSIEGIIFYENMIECENKLDEITNEFSNIFKETKSKGKNKFDHLGDKTGESKVIDSSFELLSGDIIMIGCIDWSEKLTKKNGWKDQLRITIRLKEYSDFLRNKAYE
jgi:hypothetical protein